MKMRAQSLGQKPRGDVKVFVVRFGELPAPGECLLSCGRDIGNAIGCRQRGPSAGEFATTDPILAVHDQPQSREPLVQTERRFLKDGPGFQGEGWLLMSRSEERRVGKE